MARKLIIPSVPFDFGAVKLASILPDIRYPNQDALTPVEVDEQEYYVRNFESFKGFLLTGQRSSVRARLTSLFSLSSERDKSSLDMLLSREGRIYELCQPKQLFRHLCSRQDVKDRLQEHVEDGQNTYFITGLATVFDARFINERHQLNQVDADVHIPLGLVEPSGGLITGDMADLSVAGNIQKTNDSGAAFHTPGERIFAISYRKVVFKIFKHVPSTEQENRWRMVSDNRGPHDDETDIVEADLVDTDEGSGPFETLVVGEDHEYQLFNGYES